MLQKIVKENKELRNQLEMLKAEAALKKFDVRISMMQHAQQHSHVIMQYPLLQLSETELHQVSEGPRYYKEEMMRVLTERNQLKEALISKQEELEEVRE